MMTGRDPSMRAAVAGDPALEGPSHSRRIWRWLAPSLILVGSILVFAALADGVQERGDLSAYDPAVTSEAIEGRTQLLTALARFFTFLGSAPAAAALSLGLLAWVGLRSRNWRLAGLLAGSLGVSVGLTVVLKQLFGRPRPPAGDVLGAIDSAFAFPSGHTLNATVCFGLMAGLVLLHTRSVLARVCAVAGWAALSFAVGLSRIYLGYHWATDVLAGFVLGVGVLAATALAGVLLGQGRLAPKSGNS